MPGEAAPAARIPAPKTAETDLKNSFIERINLRIYLIYCKFRGKRGMGRRLWNVYDVREFLGELSFLMTLNRYAVWGERISTAQ
ncbi:MAG: hypothetical protein ACM3U1_02375 [Chloroflexota bacterium]